MSHNGRNDGPTLTAELADYGVLVRVLGSSLNKGLTGYIVDGENTDMVGVEFDNGTIHKYRVDRLQLYTPNGQVTRRSPPRGKMKRGGQVRRPIVNPPPAVMQNPPTAERRRQPVNQPTRVDGKKPFRKNAPWNF